MSNVINENLRNIVLLGHSGSGKSFLKEAILFNASESQSGSFVPSNEEISSSDTSVFSINWKDHNYNFIDTPGYIDFYGEVLSGTSAADGAIVVVDGTTDIQAGTDKSLELTDKFNLPKIILVNKIDSEQADYHKILNQLRDRYGKKIAPFHVPIGKSEEFKGYVNVVEMFAREYSSEDNRCHTVPVPEDMSSEITSVRELLMETIAETDEALLEKFFSGEPFSKDEVHMGLRNAVINGDIIPVLCGSTAKNIGVHTLMWLSKDYFPSPLENVEPSDNKEAFVFKNIVDKFLGKVSLLKINSGNINAGDELSIYEKDEKIKINKIMKYKNEELEKVDGGTAGDIIALSHIDELETGDTVYSSSVNNPLILKFPRAQYYVALESLGKNDEDKIKKGLVNLSLEDPTLKWKINNETSQIVIGTLGEIHVDSIIKKLDEKYNVKVKTQKLIVPYRETIVKKSDVQGKYKKQSGGHGQYGDVKIIFEPCSDEHFIFEEKIVGGSIPKGYIPAVESGLKESMIKGTLKGYPVMNLKATLYDGSYHNVDSSEYAFKAAANLAFKEALTKGNSTILEPVMKMEITVPEDYTGAIMGDLNKKRGRVLGILPKGKNKQTIVAEVPQAEILDYAIDLTSMTAGRGFFGLEFERYEEIPSKEKEILLKQE